MASVFDLTYLLLKKNKEYEIYNMSDEDLKEVSPYLINRFLASNSSLVEIVAENEPFTVHLNKRSYMIAMYELLPKGFFQLKISVRDKIDKDKESIIKKISSYFSCTMEDANIYLEIMTKEFKLEKFLNEFNIQNSYQ